MESVYERKTSVKVKDYLRKRTSILGIILIIMAVVMSFMSDSFLTMSNMFNVVRSISTTIIIAVGEVLVLTAGGIDLSVGQVVAASGVTLAAVTQATGNPVLGMVIALLVGFVTGVINGILVTRAKIVPFIATLGTQQIVKGINVFCTNARPIAISNPLLASIGQGRILGVPTPIVIMAVIVCMFYVVYNKTTFGTKIQAIGGNIEAARVSGVDVNRNTMRVYIICGLLSALSGVIFASRITTGSPESGMGWEINAIAAAVIGGTSMAGGEGAIIGAVLGAMVIQFLSNAMVMLSISSNLQPVITGTLLIAVIMSDNLKRMSKK